MCYSSHVLKSYPFSINVARIITLRSSFSVNFYEAAHNDKRMVISLGGIASFHMYIRKKMHSESDKM